MIFLKEIWNELNESRRVARKLKMSQTRAKKKVRFELKSSFEPNQF